MRYRVFTALTLILAALTLVACKPSQRVSTVTVATTTSTENSGLLEYLLPEFTKDTDIAVKVIAVGTGKALRMGQDGDVDLVMVHAKRAEQAFIEADYGVERREFMYNDFIIIGPRDDPAKLGSINEINKAMIQLANNHALFVSRGDDSGTHKKERQLWQAAGIEPRQGNYRESGQGMGKTLQIANELNAYTLIDRGTWLSNKADSSLEILFEGGQSLLNQYTAILVNPSRYDDLNTKGAQKFIDWLASVKGQKLIGDFTVQGERLFVPNAG